MSKLPSISDGLEAVVAKTKTAIVANTSINFGLDENQQAIVKDLFFMHGNVKEITNVLKSMSDGSETKDKKYPLIALFRDVKEELEEQRFGFGSSFNAHLGIFNVTNPKLRAEDRKVTSFDNILIPIFEEFIRQLSHSVAFGQPRVNDMKIIKWDCYLYGSSLNDKNIFGDYVDAIDIERISLKLKNIC